MEDSTGPVAVLEAAQTLAQLIDRVCKIQDLFLTVGVEREAELADTSEVAVNRTGRTTAADSVWGIATVFLGHMSALLEAEREELDIQESVVDNTSSTQVEPS